MGRGFTTGEAFPAATSVPPGVLFHPTDEKLVSYYLKRKVMGKPCFDVIGGNLCFDVIGEVDINKLDPSNLADKEWYFFSAVHKYGTGTRVSRATHNGYWRQSGIDRQVRRGNQLIGMIKTLVFHSGRVSDGRRTNWLIHEYRLVEHEPEHNQKRGYVLCKLFQKKGVCKNRDAASLEQERDGENVKTDHFPVVVDANGNNEIQQENQSQRKFLIDLNKLPGEFEIENNGDEPLKRESAAQVLPLCVLNKEAPLPIIQYKRKRQDGASTGISNNSSQTTRQDHCSSTTTTVDTSSAAMAASLLEFSLVACSDKEKNLLLKENNPEPAVTMTTAESSSTKLINDLQKEKRQIVAERDKLKSDLIEAEMMQDILQGQINALREENEELRKNSRSNSNMEQCS